MSPACATRQLFVFFLVAVCTANGDGNGDEEEDKEEDKENGHGRTTPLPYQEPSDTIRG